MTDEERRCHICKADISNRGSAARFCLPCYTKRAKDSAAKWIENNWEKHLESAKLSKRRNKAKCLEYNHKWWKEHREERRLKQKEYKERNREDYLKMRNEYQNIPSVKEMQKIRHKIKRVKKKGFCDKCGKEGKTQFHHISYVPDVHIELCLLCHNREHKRCLE